MAIEQQVYTTAIITTAMLLVVIWMAIRISKLGNIRKQFFASGPTNLEEVLVEQNRKINDLDRELTKLGGNLRELTILNRHNVQKIGFVRFNPFDDAGGNMSFALALLSADNSGVVISSLHGREGTRIYAKNVKAGKSESKLTDEENLAINQAK